MTEFQLNLGNQNLSVCRFGSLNEALQILQPLISLWWILLVSESTLQKRFLLPKPSFDAPLKVPHEELLGFKPFNFAFPEIEIPVGKQAPRNRQSEIKASSGAILWRFNGTNPMPAIVTFD